MDTSEYSLYLNIKKHLPHLKSITILKNLAKDQYRVHFHFMGNIVVELNITYEMAESLSTKDLHKYMIQHITTLVHMPYESKLLSQVQMSNHDQHVAANNYLVQNKLAAQQMIEQFKALPLEQIINKFPNIVLSTEMQKIVEEKVIKALQGAGENIYDPFNVKQQVNVPSAMQKILPSYNAIVNYPCECHDKIYNNTGLLSSAIIHLNDTHRWSRDAIADWLESLDIDLEFKVPEEVSS